MVHYFTKTKPLLSIWQANFHNAKCKVVADSMSSTKMWVISPWNQVIFMLHWHLSKWVHVVICMFLPIKHLLEVGFLWFEVRNRCCEVDYNIFIPHQKVKYEVTMTVTPFWFLLVWAKIDIVTSHLLIGCICWFKVIGSCIVVSFLTMLLASD